MIDAECVRERSWVEDGRWWYERRYSDGRRHVACRVQQGPREAQMGWLDKPAERVDGDADSGKHIAPRIDDLVMQHRRGDLDAETLAYACYSVGWGDAIKRPKRFTPETATNHTPEVQS